MFYITKIPTFPDAKFSVAADANHVRTLPDAMLYFPYATRSSFKTVGDCPNFAKSSEQIGTGTIRLGMVPLSEDVLSNALS